LIGDTITLSSDTRPTNSKTKNTINKELPDTGEVNSNWFLSLLGVFLIVSVYLLKKKENKR
ncbi:LPXTG cell wall anchor domain-containing protein, partial [Enterococcus faecalis]|nr:LPXTG cell wall anchor domain-containing protein [Enterococcus faecalis]